MKRSSFQTTALTLIAIVCNFNLLFSQNTYTVTSSLKDGPGSFIEAITLANNNPGADIIEFTSGLKVDASHSANEINPANPIMVKITESVTINGNNATLIGKQNWINSSGQINNLTFCPGDVSSTLIMNTMPGFVQIGTIGQDNSAIEVKIQNLTIQQFNQIAIVAENAKLEFENFNAYDTWATYSCGSESPILIYSGASLFIKDSELLNCKNWAIQGLASTILGVNASDLIIEGTYFDQLNNGEQFAIDWNGEPGSIVNIVSTRFSKSGGIRISGNVGASNIVNSSWVNFFTQTPLYADRIMNYGGGDMNIIASSFMWNSDLCDGVCQSFSNFNNLIENNGTGTINFSESAIGYNFASPNGITLNTIGGTGNFNADIYTWIQPTILQDSSVLKSLTGQSGLLTNFPSFSGPIIIPTFDYDIEMLTPDFPGELIDAIPSSYILINPIDSSPLLYDVVGNPRLDYNNKRDIGAIQLTLAPFLSYTGANDGSVDIAWHEPLHHNNLPIIRYEVSFQIVGSASPSIATVGPSELSTSINGLLNGAEYDFMVRAIYDDNGTEQNGPFSNLVVGTPIGHLDSPTLVASSGDQLVSLNWDMPYLGGRTFEAYVLLWKVDGTANYIGSKAILDSNQTSTIINGLMNNTTYKFAIRVKASGDYSLDDYAIATPSATLGINEYLDENLIVYPNPLKDHLNVNIEGDFNAKVYSIEGTLLLEEVNNKSLDLSSFSNGTYILCIIRNNKYYLKRIIKN